MRAYDSEHTFRSPNLNSTNNKINESHFAKINVMLTNVIGDEV